MIETFRDGLPGEVHDLATAFMTEICARGRMVAVAESCTGGLLAAVLTDVEGCSHGFDRGFVTYTDDAKRDALGVPDAVLREQTAVSEAAARAMAEGALARSKADLALSITGYAGPGAADEEPGLVWFALADRGGPGQAFERRFGEVSRAEVRRQCLRVGIELLRQKLSILPPT